MRTISASAGGTSTRWDLYRRVLTGSFYLALFGSATSCAGSDQQMSLQQELDAARLASETRTPASCHPGVKEACYSGPEGTAGRGNCRAGERACDSEGQWLTCEAEVTPGNTELCNDVDDDCNGIVDDNFHRSGTQCWAGEGECRSQGAYQCSADGHRSECNAVAKQPSSEMCDGKDNDCNGKVDDGLVQGTGDTCSTGKAGQCNAGIKQCVGASIQCVADHQASIEICNKLDDDCDNEIDEECVTEEEAREARAKQ